VETTEGVNIDCKVNAAAVWISSGGGNCSTGKVQATITRSSIKAGKPTFKRAFIPQL